LQAQELDDAGKEEVILALNVLAKERDNDVILQNAILTLSPDKAASDIAEAKRLLRLNDDLNDESIWGYYISLKADAGGAVGTQEKLTAALETVARERKSDYLLAMLKDPNSNPQMQPAGAMQPIGLQNIGNTCYLNSLLQYYYTVKVIREVVMNFDQYRMNLTSGELATKRVGGRKISQSEIIKAQQCMYSSPHRVSLLS
jgi:ubiquitin carboxyl-terminal hydrolase 25/28